MPDKSRVASAEEIIASLFNFRKEKYSVAGDKFFATILGDDFNISRHEDEMSAQEFIEEFDEGKYKKEEVKQADEKTLIDKVEYIYISRAIERKHLAEVAAAYDILLSKDANRVDKFIFLVVALKGDKHNKSTYAKLTRIINKRQNSPTVILFCDKPSENKKISLSLIERRPDKQNEEVDVLSNKVSMLYNIDCEKPHRADIDLLSELNIPQLMKEKPSEKHLPKIRNFDQVVYEWLKIISIEKLNNKFYQELLQWFEMVNEDDAVKFPIKYQYFDIEDGKEVIKVKDIKKKEQIIRLITRFMFIWFIKEKDIIPEKLFAKKELFMSKDLVNKIDKQPLLKNTYNAKEGNYYRAVLQNLFFATLNTPIKEEGKKIRGFSSHKRKDHRNFNKWRYKNEISDPEIFEATMNEIPFVNGGLFDCLDSFHGTKSELKMYGGKKQPSYRLDCFTDTAEHRRTLHVPNIIFFGESDDDMRGLINIFKSYKFTVEENTPLDIAVALDPELLGMTFENLLASYNDETEEVARKATGSYYTPRHIVHFMAKESLKEYIDKKFNEQEKNISPEQLDSLFDNTSVDVNKELPNGTKEMIVKAINDLKILDPAVGSGAFPMEVLNICVSLLSKVDPDNKIWEEEQINSIPKYQALQVDKKTSNKIKDDDARIKAQDTLKEKEKQIKSDFKENNNNYSRKLYLIRNTIFGVDIQPIACQIACLRFFISLAIEQDKNINAKDKNYGINPLPNLETNLIAANTLNGETEAFEIIETVDSFGDLYKQIVENRKQFFNVRNRSEKRDLIERDAELREQLGDDIEKQFYPRGDTIIDKKRNKKRESIIQAVHDIKSWNFADQNVAAQWFNSSIMFNVKKDFDIIIGNPPYVRQEVFKKDKPKIKLCHAEVFHGRADLYTYFYSLGFNLLSPSGNLCFITSNKWYKVDSGRKLRQFFKNKIGIKFMLDLKERVFTAGVDTCIVLAKLKNDSRDAKLHYGNFVPDKALSLPWIDQKYLEEDVFVIKHNDIINIKKHMDKVGTKFKAFNSSHIFRGIKTGAKPAFIISDERKIIICKENENSQEVMVPLIEANQITSHHYARHKKWLVNTHNGYRNIDGKEVPPINVKNYPAVKEHLDNYKLSNRKSKGDTQYNLPGYGFLPLLLQEKVIWRNINSEFTAALDTEGIFILDTCSFVCCPGYNKYLVALFNSKLINYYCRLTLPGMGDSTLEHKPLYLYRLPIVDIEKADTKPYDEIVDTIIRKKKAGEPTEKEEQEIDEMVYKLYKISPAQRDLIEEELAKTQTKK